MGLLIALLNKLLWFGLFMSILNLIRHIYNLIQTYVASSEVTTAKYLMSPMGLLFLGLSISYVLMTIFSGVVLK